MRQSHNKCMTEEQRSTDVPSQCCNMTGEHLESDLKGICVSDIQTCRSNGEFEKF